MKLVTVVGARPQFIKAAPVSKVLHALGNTEFILHTGQHYDFRMSEIFFDELGIPEPNLNLGIGSGLHGWQTGEMLIGIEKALLREQPDWVLVYGDTNSTLAGALAACKLHIPVAHVESGLRSYNRMMPEEYNRVLTDHAASLLFCPTQSAVATLRGEGITRGVHFTGDTMYDAVLMFAERAQQRSTILSSLNLASKGYVLATIHRPGNTDDRKKLETILDALAQTGETIVMPLHPRTRKALNDYGLTDKWKASTGLVFIDPVGYLDMLVLEENARMILTDSGGIQKEAYFFEVPCLTLRNETEWVETVDAGWNRLVGADRDSILRNIDTFDAPGSKPPELFGDGNAAHKIVALLMDQG